MKAQDKKSPNISFDVTGKIDQFVDKVPTISPYVLGQDVKKQFEDNPNLEGIVVIENGQPVGLIMRTAFYQKMGSLHGHSLFMKRPINILMDTDMMTIDVGENISEIGIRAMNRPQGKVYDYILINKNGRYFGAISIRLFLVDLAKQNAAQINVLTVQQKELLSAHQKEKLLTKNLASKTASIRNLLNNADQGFLFFEQDLNIKDEFSYKCVEIFGENISNSNYLDLVSCCFEREKTEVFAAAFDSYFKNNSAITDNVYLMLLPTECVISDRHIHFDYRRIKNNGKKAVMAILNDVTDKINMNAQMEKDRTKQRLLIKALSYHAQIKQMIDEFIALFTGGYNAIFSGQQMLRPSLNELYRVVHTFKGDFAQYGFTNASKHLHIFEDELSKLVNREGDILMAEVEMIMSELDPHSVLEDDLRVIHSVLGDTYFNQSEMVQVPKERIAQAITAIQNSEHMDKQTVLGIISRLKHKNIKAYLTQYKDYVEYLSGRLNKPMPLYIVEGDDLEIDPDHYQQLLKSLVHLYRNIMDHGIEQPEERLVQEKPERGLIVCKTKREGSTITIGISDDGKGIDLEKLKQKAVNNGTYTHQQVQAMSQEKVTNLIFADNVSTKDSATTVSGRGVGMSAFKQTCEKLGATIRVTTTDGQGTMFTITLPNE